MWFVTINSESSKNLLETTDESANCLCAIAYFNCGKLKKRSCFAPKQLTFENTKKFIFPHFFSFLLCKSFVISGIVLSPLCFLYCIIVCKSFAVYSLLSCFRFLLTFCHFASCFSCTLYLSFFFPLLIKYCLDKMWVVQRSV